MLFLCFSHVVTVASPFRSSVFHYLAESSKICEIIFHVKTMKLSLLHKNVNTPSHRKSKFNSSYDYRFEICPANYRYPRRDHETWFELSKFSSYPGLSYLSFTVQRLLSNWNRT